LFLPSFFFFLISHGSGSFQVEYVVVLSERPWDFRFRGKSHF
jgi:hypothetical protein